MEEKQIQAETPEIQNFEPSSDENSVVEYNGEVYPASEHVEGQSHDPSEDMILGKFKSVEELSKAYVELQRHQGQHSQELGNLRREASSMSNLTDSLKQAVSLSSQMAEKISQYREKYNQPEYFQEPAFRNLYKEAFLALGENLDTDMFVNLLEEYVRSRISSYDKKRSAQNETQQILDSMTYSKNPKSGFTRPKKSFDEMTPQEIKELADKYI